MKHLNKILWAVVMLLTASCLDRFPEDQISEESFFKSPKDFELFTNSFYGALPTYNTNDLMSDLVRAGGPNAVSNGTNIAVESDGTWNNSYAQIRKCNYLLNKAEGFADQESIKQAVGTTKFFRALAYFNLMKKFGGVPIVKAVLDIDSEELKAPRNSRQEVLDLVIADLNEAIKALPKAKDVGDANHGKITEEGAQAFLARVALFEGTWRKFRGENGKDLLTTAQQMSKKVMESDQFSLFKSPALGDRSYQYLFSLDNEKSNPAGITKSANKEFVLVAKYDKDTRSAPRSNMDITHSPTRKLADMFLCADGLPIDKSPMFKGKKTLTSEFENRDLRMSCDFQIPHKQYWNNWPSWSRDWAIPDEELGDPNTSRGWLFWHEISWNTRTSTGYGGYKHYVEGKNNYPFGGDYGTLRLAEVYLIYAEATFELNGNISDADLDMSINKLRERADMPRLTNGFVNANGLDMQEEIRRERAVELCFEGFRYDDLRRWYTAHVELSKPILGVKFTGTEYETYEFSKGYKGALDPDGFVLVETDASRQFNKDKNYLFPLPLKQLQLNSNLEQNPGW
ncbi:membrane protein [Fulvitalea axinellae]|uniref:Membrane protein n=1 Tax=Fulvitalea axinellae TaxID=1182444 RepID=A0AAU9CCY4_9BACT|nr:membrane protein [Fulvitalea axinellae]